MLVIIIALIAAVAADFDLTILHTNDVHARIEETDKNSGPCTADLLAQGNCFGGASRIRTKVMEKRKQYPNQTLLLDAGDQFQGTLWFYVFGGHVSAQFVNLIGYDAMAIGNHEFDSGIKGLAPFAHNLTFPLLSSNMNVSNTKDLADVVKKSAVVRVGGQDIGIVGYTTTETPFISSSETVTFTEELGAVQAEIDKFVCQGINKIIAVGHSGFAVDLDLARRLNNVDIVVGGHTNTFLYNGTSPSSEKPQGIYPTVIENVNGGQVLVVQDYAYGKYLGELHVTFNDEGKVTKWFGNPILLDKSVEKDSETEALIQKYLPEIEEMKTTLIGETRVDLMADRVLCRTTECNLGNLVTDAIVHQSLRPSDPNDSWTDAGIAVVNAGSFRASIVKGPITIEKVIFVQPFRNTVDIMEILGETLIEMLEYGASKWTQNPDDAFGGFLQVSGLQITYNISRPVGKRVVEVLAVCTKCKVPELQLLIPNKVYKILISSYILGGGDGYSMLPGKVLKVLPVGYLDTDIVLSYVKKFSPITVGLQGRIRHVKSESGACDAKGTGNLLSVGTTSLIFQLVLLWTSLFNII